MEATLEPKRAIAERSAEANILIKRLKKLTIGELVGYDELSHLISGDVQTKHRYLLETARRALLNEDRVVIECVWGEGVKRLENEAIPAIGAQARGRIHRISKKAAKKMTCADFDKLSNEQKLEWNTNMSLMGVLAMVTKTSKILQLKAAVTAIEDRLPLNKTLELFKT